MHRKTFIKNSLIAGGVLMSGPLFSQACSSGVTQKNPLFPGVQIYSVRNELQKDMEGTLQKLYGIGFRSIEGYGLMKNGTILGQSLSDFKAMLDRTGLTMPSCHCEYFTQEEAGQMLAHSKALNLQYLVIPYLNDDQRTDYPAVAKNLNEIGDVFSSEGLRLGYHNHAFEFEPLEDGRIPMELLIEETEAGKVWFEADLYWIRKAGRDPLSWLNSYPDRFKLFHIKDADEQLDQTTVGEGIIDFEAILKAFDSGSIDHAFIEDERTVSPLENLRKAYDHIKKYG